MHKLYFTLLFAACAVIVNAQIDPPCGIPGAYLCDNFDAYTAGDPLGPGASWWTTWSGAEGGAEDGIVSDTYAYSGTNSMLIPGGGITDVVLKLGNQSTGIWRLEWMCYLPDGATGYYNIQESETPGVAWNLEVLYGLYDYTTPAPSGEGVIMVPVEENFSYPVASWFKVEHLINLDDNTIEVIMDGVTVMEYDYTGDIGGADFYSIDANVEMYIDDVLLIEEVLNTYFEDADDDTYGNPLASIAVAGPAPSGYVLDNTDCDDTNAAINPGATEVFNGVDDNCNNEVDEGTVGIEDQNNAALLVYPVPATDHLMINLPVSVTGTVHIQLINAIGQSAYSETSDAFTGATRLPVGDLAAGVYVLSVRTADTQFSEQVIIE